MHVSKITGAALAGLLLTASVGLTACSSSSASSSGASAEASTIEATGGTVTTAASASGGVDSSEQTTVESACAAIEAAGTGYMQAYTSTVSDDWNKFSEEVLALSDSATDEALQGSLMNLAVAGQFTVTGLESSEDLTTAKGDFDTTLGEMNTVCTAAGAPLTLPGAAASPAASAAASPAPSASAS
jgi:hypothetical protein